MPQTARSIGAQQQERAVSFFTRLLDVILQRPQAPIAARQPQPFEESIALIKRIGEMQPGFNGHRSVVAPEHVRETAIRFLRTMTANFGPSAPEPSMVAPTSDGGVSLEWRLREPAEAVEIVFLPSGLHEYTLFGQTHEDIPEDELLRLVKIALVGRRTT